MRLLWVLLICSFVFSTSYPSILHQFFLSFLPPSLLQALSSDSKLTVYFIARNIAASDDVSFHFYRRQPQTDPNLHESNASICGEDREDASAHGHRRMFPHRCTARSALEHHAEEFRRRIYQIWKPQLYNRRFLHVSYYIIYFQEKSRMLINFLGWLMFWTISLNSVYSFILLSGSRKIFD